MRTHLFIINLILCSFLTVNATVINYTPNNTTIFKNPERGFTEELNRVVSESKPNVVKGNLSSSSSSYWTTDNMTLVMVLYNFNNYKTKDLPTKVLTGFDEDMQELRNYGMKCVLRFAYTESESDKVDATPAWVKRHLEQLKPHLAANADVIYVLEAGFVGVWGEWYYTSNYGNESQTMNDNRRKVVNYLLENAPEDRFVLFRYPLIKIGYLGDENTLTAEEAFTGSKRARMGCHNDAFLNDWGNDGTYGRDGDGPDDDPVLRQYIADETLYVPNGGETNVEGSTLAKKVYKNAPAEMATYHWSFCGRSYATAVTGRWRDSGIFDTLNVHMGYRYNLIDGQYSDKAAPGGQMNVTIRVRNDGYAPIYNERPVYVVLKAVNGQQSAVSIRLKADPRRWLPNGKVSTITEKVSIPSDLSEGKYHLYLWMPDAYETLASDARYSVRMANTGIWNENTGYNDLGTTIEIDKNAPAGTEDLSDPTSEIKPKKMIENGLFYILMPNGKKYYCL